MNGNVTTNFMSIKYFSWEETSPWFNINNYILSLTGWTYVRCFEMCYNNNNMCIYCLLDTIWPQMRSYYWIYFQKKRDIREYNCKCLVLLVSITIWLSWIFCTMVNMRISLKFYQMTLHVMLYNIMIWVFHLQSLLQ